MDELDDDEETVTHEGWDVAEVEVDDVLDVEDEFDDPSSLSGGKVSWPFVTSYTMFTAILKFVSISASAPTATEKMGPTEMRFGTLSPGSPMVNRVC